MSSQSMNSLTLNRIEYNKKPGKPTVIKVIKDPGVPRDDLYKSGTIHTGPGEPPNSQSRPTPRGKRVAGKPITQGKLLRPGGPGGGPSKLVSRPVPSQPTAQPIPQSVPHSMSRPAQSTPTHSILPPFSQSKPSAPQPRPIPASNVSQQVSIPQAALPQLNFNPQTTVSQGRTNPQPVAALNGISHSRNTSTSSVTRAPPPPPPVAAPTPRQDLYRALYPFAGQSKNELTLEKNEVIEILRKESNGKQPFPSLFFPCSNHFLQQFPTKTTIL